MKKTLLVLGILLMTFSAFAVFLGILNAPRELTDIRYSPTQNIASYTLIMLVYVGLFYLGYRLFRAGRKPARMKHRTPAAAPLQQGFQANLTQAKVENISGTETGQPAVPADRPEQEASVRDRPPIDCLSLPAEMLDDVSYIRDMHHTISGIWHQYDILLDTGGYGWETILSWAQYLADSDLRLETVSSGNMGSDERDCISSVRQHGGILKDVPELAQEQGYLGIGGASAVLPTPVKFVWFNQTRILRIFALLDDEALMTRYAETAIRRTFGTPDAMKLAKPHPKGGKN